MSVKVGQPSPTWAAQRWCTKRKGTNAEVRQPKPGEGTPQQGNQRSGVTEPHRNGTSVGRRAKRQGKGLSDTPTRGGVPTTSPPRGQTALSHFFKMHFM